MSDEIEIRGEREGVNLLFRWLRGDDITNASQGMNSSAGRARACSAEGNDGSTFAPAILDYDRRKPTTTAESEAAFAAYKTLLLVELTKDEQADWETQRQEGERD